MIDIRRILCPVDFSEASKEALQFAADLAKYAIPPGQRPFVPLGVDEEVRVRLIDVDELEATEIDRIGGGGPDAAEKVGIAVLQPQAAPAADSPQPCPSPVFLQPGLGSEPLLRAGRRFLISEHRQGIL